MPRNRNRFGALMREYRVAGGTPAAGTRAAGFKEWLEGRRKIEVKNPVPAAARKRFEIVLIPFGMDVDADVTKSTKAIVTASAYSLSAVYGGSPRLTGATKAEYGHLEGNDAVGAAKIDGFYPALVVARCSRSGAALDNEKKSGVTGLNYKYLPARTFRVPFGRKASAATKDFYTRAKELKTEIKGAESLSFQEEVFDNAMSSGGAFDPAKNTVAVN